MLVLQTTDDPRLVDLILKGSVGVLPTDTIYGLIALAYHREAVAKLYSLKNREQKPGTVIAANINQLIDLDLDPTTLKTIAHVWPNPLSLVIPAPESLDYLTQQVGSLAVRIPKDEHICQLLTKTGPLLTSSANHPGDPPADNVEDAQAYFGNSVDFYVDGGDLGSRPPSTVARLRPDGTLTVLRQGATRIDAEGNVTS